jgi:hypothetical protein
MSCRRGHRGGRVEEGGDGFGDAIWDLGQDPVFHPAEDDEARPPVWRHGAAGLPAGLNRSRKLACDFPAVMVYLIDFADSIRAECGRTKAV